MSKIKDKRRSNHSKVKKVLLKGPLFTSSGYGVHSRQVFLALSQRKDIDLFLMPTEWGNTSWILDHNFNNCIIKKMLNYARKDFSNTKFDVSYQVLLPNEWTKIAHKNVGITAGFEADIVKESWIDACNLMNAVITPSEFTRMSFVKTSRESKTKLKTDIKVINEWYYNEFDNLKEDKDFFDFLSFDKNILVMGQITSMHPEGDRKNFIKTIKTALKFCKNKDIGLVLKINAGKNTSKLKNAVIENIKKNISQDDFKKITFLFGNFSIQEIKNLYTSNKISCMLSGSRAEGWGLPLIEAASCGLPIIATDYSAYKEFLEEDFIKVKYDLVEFKHDLKFVDLDKSPKWAEFDENSMLNSLEFFFKNTAKNKDISVKREKIIKQRYNINTIINCYKTFFKSNF